MTKIQNNGQKKLTVHRNKYTRLLEVSFTTTQKKEGKTAIAHNILPQATKLELSMYYHDELFSPQNTSLLNDTKQVFLKTWPLLTESLINKYLENFIDNTTVHLHMKRQGKQ